MIDRYNRDRLTLGRAAHELDWYTHRIPRDRVALRSPARQLELGPELPSDFLSIPPLEETPLVQPRLLRTATVALVALLLVGTAAAQTAPTPRKHHPWAAFSPGAWRQARLIVQVFDKQGNLVDWGVTERTTTLEKVDDDGVTLRVEESVWVNGTWRDRPVQTVKQGFYGESEGQKAEVKELAAETLTIEGRKIPVSVREVRLIDASSKSLQQSTIYFNDDVPPFVLKQTTTIKDADQKTVLSEKRTTVDGLQMLCLVADQPYSAAQVRTTTTHAKGTTVTVAYASSDVPGGVVHECTKKVDKDNRLVERSVLELIDCDAARRNERPSRRTMPRRGRNWRLRAEREGADKADELTL